MVDPKVYDLAYERIGRELSFRIRVQANVTRLAQIIQDDIDDFIRDISADAEREEIAERSE